MKEQSGGSRRQVQEESFEMIMVQVECVDEVEGKEG